MSIRVFLADDHRILRDGLRALISREADVEVIGEAADGRSAVEQVLRLSPDVVVADIGMPELNGIEATRQIVASRKSRVIMLSAYADKRYVMAALDAGAAGFVVKSGAGEALLHGVRAVHSGHMYLSPEVAASVVDASLAGSAPAPASAWTVLSAREKEIVQLLAEGRTSKEMARRLGICDKTVETHRRNIMKKLDLHSVAELTKYAVREGLTSL